jgi:hypothetical protein
MEHLELHVLNSSHDIELAIIAGLIDEFEDVDKVACNLCEGLIQFNSKTPKIGFIVLSEETMTISCDTCLTSSVESVMVTIT